MISKISCILIFHLLGQIDAMAQINSVKLKELLTGTVLSKDSNVYSKIFDVKWKALATVNVNDTINYIDTTIKLKGDAFSFDKDSICYYDSKNSSILLQRIKLKFFEEPGQHACFIVSFNLETFGVITYQVTIINYIEEFLLIEFTNLSKYDKTEIQDQERTIAILKKL